MVGLKLLGRAPYVLAAIAALSGCDAGGAAVGRAILTPPSQMDAETRAAFDALPLMGSGIQLSLCRHISDNIYHRVAADIPLYTQALEKRGLSSREASLILAGDYGTGMTWRGLSCLEGAAPQINASFYPGVGHQWQAVLPGPAFVYLRGDGTPAGMKVYAWN